MALTGLTGIEGVTIDNPELPPEAIHGGPANPAHGIHGEQARPYPWQAPPYTNAHGPYGPQNGILGSEDDAEGSLAAGFLSDDPTADLVPYRGHAAPWPKDPIGDGSVSPDNTVRQIVTNNDIRSTDLGSSRKHLYEPTLEANNDSWHDFYMVDPGTSIQPTGVPQAIGMNVGGFGSRDRVNSHARQNSYGFDSAHMHRRYATGSIPGNYQWMKPGSRPMVRSLTGIRHFPTGEDTPFTNDDTAATFGVHGAILTQPATEYVAPPQPYTAPAVSPNDQGGSMEIGWNGW